MKQMGRRDGGKRKEAVQLPFPQRANALITVKDSSNTSLQAQSYPSMEVKVCLQWCGAVVSQK